VGKVTGAHGLRGLVRVHPYGFSAASLRTGRTVLLEQAGARRAAHVHSAEPHGRGTLLVALAGVSDRSAAEALAGASILVRLADLPPPGDDEFYYHEVVGFEVETTTGERLGTIAETFPTGSNDVWVVRGAGREHLIPVIADVVRVIDRPARHVLIDPLPGLLD